MDMAVKLFRHFALGLVIASSSCTAMPPLATAPQGAAAPSGVATGQIANPIFVAANSGNPESDLFVNERAADVLAKYNFEIDTNNQLEGTIATQYKVGSGILEPWHRESVGLQNRLQSTLQPIRRKVLIHFVRVEGGYLVSVEALKELEDLAAPSPNTPGGSTFPQNYPLRRDLNLVLGQAAPSGWIPLGRDAALEQDMLCRLQAAYAVR
jgi:hypothetical protein